MRHGKEVPQKIAFDKFISCDFVKFHLLLKLFVELKDCHCPETLKLFKLTTQCLERAQDLLSTSQGLAVIDNLWC
jgi:hypothetical protein